MSATTKIAEMSKRFHAVCHLHVFADGWQKLSDFFVTETGFVEAGEHAFSHMATTTRCLFDQARDHADVAAPCSAPVVADSVRAPGILRKDRFGQW